MRRIDFRQWVTTTLARLRRGTLRRRRVRHGIPECLESRVLLDASLVKDINPVRSSIRRASSAGVTPGSGLASTMGTVRRWGGA